MVHPLPPTDSDPEHLPPGTAVGEYLIEARIGVGGFARVYRARHPVLATRVAVKVITRSLALHPEASQRFIREARAASRIAHPGVVRVLGFGTLADDRAYQVMELVEGPSLADYLADRGPVPVAEALRMLEEIAAGLDAAHAAGIVHRDLKPSNILLAPSGGRMRPMLADFGIAKALEEESNQHLTRTGTTLGTPAYMSPEQALGRDVGVASDVYSFGVVAYELLTGRVPFEGESPLETMMMHVQTAAAAPSRVEAELGERFDAALAWLLAKHPGERPATPAEAMAALRSDASAPVATVPRRRRAPAIAIGVGAALALAVAVWVTRPEPAAAPPAGTARPVAAPPASRAPAPAAHPTEAPTPPAAANEPRAGSAVEPPPAAATPRPDAPARRIRPTAAGKPGAARPTPTKDSFEAPPDYAP
jgi:serine/threonine-protein kinase